MLFTCTRYYLYIELDDFISKDTNYCDHIIITIVIL